MISGMTTTVKNLIQQVQALSPEDRGELRAWMNSANPAGDDSFARKLIESGVGRPRPSGPRRASPQPVPAQGQPLSEQLIEERR